MFDITTRTMLQHYTAHPPATDDGWYGAWITILTTLFPSTQGYVVSLQGHLPDDPDCHIVDSVLEVVKLTTRPFTFRTVLIAKVKNSQNWTAGIPALERELIQQTHASFASDVFFARTAHKKVYWIGSIGPHWRYGENVDHGKIQPLIDWHDTTDDKSSFDDLQVLARLVAAL